MAIYKEALEQNYTVVGSPVISSEGIVTGINPSNYLSRPSDTIFSPGTSAWEIKAKVTTGSSLGSEEMFIDPNSDQRGIRIGFQNKSGLKWQFLVSRGTSWISTSAYYGSHTVQPNTTYWIKAGYTGSEYYLEYSTDGSEYTRDISYSSSYFVGAYALQIRSLRNYSWSGSVDLKETSVSIGEDIWWKPTNTYLKDVSGSVKISRGYYSDGVNEIVLGTKDYNIDALTSGQTTGGKNKLFVYKDTSDNTGALLSSTTPTGDFKVTKDLEHPIYLSNLKNYIAGDTLQIGEVTFSNADAEIWVQPILTSATSYGAVTDSRKSTNEAGWKALDGDSSTQYVPGTGTAWWKWELPEYLIFTPESSITWTHRNNSETFNGTMCRFFADEAMSIRLTPDFTDTSSSLSSVTVPCSDITEPVTTNVIYWTKDSGGGWGGASSITFNNVYKGTGLFKGVRIGKTLQYSESQDKTYWIPKQISVPLSDIASTQSVGTVNRLYLTLKGDVTSISFSNNGVINGVDSYMATGLNVYLSDDLTTILNIGE